ncbi:hypothetical protein AQUCO_02500300v1 [Aquilegia coerulea]|uniref:Response regulatory domain-containing protein n=1 Tax=Aquilegia coerulea TaxID=218851 RepID=A0A2G5DAJ5_AQUCA|nr:hypothetical protein AQUCO_02500300v1 [Aquilegia coerulea]
MSSDGRDQTIARGLREGARSFLRKTFGFQEIQQIWQHSVVRRRADNLLLNLPSEEVESNEYLGESDTEVNSGLYDNDGNRIWTTELYPEFLSGIKVVSLFANPEPGNIYDYMRNRGITIISRENVASHT